MAYGAPLTIVGARLFRHYTITSTVVYIRLGNMTFPTICQNVFSEQQFLNELKGVLKDYDSFAMKSAFFCFYFKKNLSL